MAPSESVKFAAHWGLGWAPFDLLALERSEFRFGPMVLDFGPMVLDFGRVESEHDLQDLMGTPPRAGGQGPRAAGPARAPQWAPPVPVVCEAAWASSEWEQPPLCWTMNLACTSDSDGDPVRRWQSLTGGDGHPSPRRFHGRNPESDSVREWHPSQMLSTVAASWRLPVLTHYPTWAGVPTFKDRISCMILDTSGEEDSGQREANNCDYCSEGRHSVRVPDNTPYQIGQSCNPEANSARSSSCSRGGR